MTAQSGGASAYFSAPEPDLDPALFSAGTLKAGISDFILARLGAFFRGRGIEPGTWLHAWLAGSGVSYQWRASRGNGDLDVLLGIDTVSFLAANPDFAAGSRAQLAAMLNEQMKQQLWPVTAATTFGDIIYEVTYYWNPDVSDDIRVIHPYAAWSLDNAQWDVLPDHSPPAGSFPEDWFAAARQDTARVAELYALWAQNLHDSRHLPSVNPARAAAASTLRRVTAELRSIWYILHDGRRSAFLDDGQGWADFHNFRWQAAKASGAASLLREVIAADDRLQAETDTALYGAPVEPAETALRRAAAAYTRWAQ